jgi:hypothetical protein
MGEWPLVVMRVPETKNVQGSEGNGVNWFILVILFANVYLILIPPIPIDPSLQEATLIPFLRSTPFFRLRRGRNTGPPSSPRTSNTFHPHKMSELKLLADFVSELNSIARGEISANIEANMPQFIKMDEN